MKKEGGLRENYEEEERLKGQARMKTQAWRRITNEGDESIKKEEEWGRRRNEQEK